MTEVLDPTPRPYSFGRGVAFALLAIPLAAAVTTVLASLGFGFAPAFAAVGMLAVFALFTFGSRRKTISGAGFALSALIGAIAVTLGFISGYLAAIYRSFISVGDKGGLFGSVFARRVELQLSNSNLEVLIPALLVIVFSVILVGSAARNALAARREPADVHTADASDGSGAPGAQAATPANTPVSPAPRSSPGILLNGEPLATQPEKKSLWNRSAVTKDQS
ncbi:hypothetical protein I6E74_03500 [Salinibacterium sp. SWN139]|uniref:hypothetical protein n=1 Tax=Salinibacterium sp. SWN139 TaxID=2792055 RepID=UPI0018CDCC90|nr:hypothetical protein [Salinibacterium sp. SWN139]MBH0053232.1 hypothetical protein [Salinibacterium sp. SWN139]